MQDRKYFGLSSVSLVLILGALVKFAIHLYYAPGYGLFFDELYTIALSRHLAFGYVDLPPLVPALVALSRLLLGESFFAMHIVPALAGSELGPGLLDHKGIRWQDICRGAERTGVHRRSLLAHVQFHILLR